MASRAARYAVLTVAAAIVFLPIYTAVVIAIQPAPRLVDFPGLLRQAFLGVPRDLRDAAAMDGYGHWGFLRGVAVPLARPAIAAFTVFSFLLGWNQYLWPLLVTNGDAHRTVQIGLKAISGASLT